MNPTRYLEFVLGEVACALEVRWVRQVLPRAAVEPPGGVSGESPLLGFLDVGGERLPVLDVRGHFSAVRPPGPEARFVVAENSSSALILQVDRVVGVREASPSALEPAPPTLLGVDRRLVARILREGDRLVLFLDPDALGAR